MEFKNRRVMTGYGYTTLRTEDGGTLQVPNNLFFAKVLKRHLPAALAHPRPSPV